MITALPEPELEIEMFLARLLERKRIPYLNESGDPRGGSNTITMATLDKGGVYLDMADGSRFKIRVTKTRTRGAGGRAPSVQQAADRRAAIGPEARPAKPNSSAA